ncbi:MAG TPA: tRNA (N(6)-L-threonylcarbamoyladenosine(37)-C(2))-methylthiotransferase MtaB [bacterium]|nr:tRNA (N(6)-L-threonylcarbamoyladenosine(37)-C(2))-methylthiotransferase MtaB [bacterium]HPT29698.1 tRNA (N(6)-L-threonylcarbamoyladenosine(37)-C(2))-methylthiotransferase MtaB [bacterium]
MTEKSYKIYTLGCKVNQYDSGRLAQLLTERGFVSKESGAALVVVNTCAVTKTAIAKGKRMLAQARKENPRAKIVLAGCWPKVYGSQAIPADLVYDSRDWRGLIKEVEGWFQTANLVDIHNPLSLNQDRSRYFLKIQDGCNQFCSYCVIPYARGPLVSRTEKEILAEIRQALKSGYQEIVLSGIHLGRYGQDTKTDLISLLKKILAIKKNFRLRLSSIEIIEIDDALIKLMVKDRRLCRHLHIPLQAGSDQILKLMNRPYSQKYFVKRVKEIKKALPDIAISTDIIVGFPKETRKDFLESYNLAKKLQLSRLHVFSFSAHEKTKAFSLTPRVKPEEIKKRSAELRKLSVSLEDEYQKKIIKKYRGQKLAVIVERQKGEYYLGKSEYYVDFWFRPEQKKKISIGQLFDLTL